jgi:CheY-like chemotaxis protein
VDRECQELFRAALTGPTLTCNIGFLTAVARTLLQVKLFLLFRNEHWGCAMAGSKILCIDDEEMGLLVRKLILESEGFEVATAADGKSGLQLFNDGRFDLVLLDHSMPGMNGGEVAQQMRQRSPNIPIILLSAYVTLPEEHVSIVDAYITKGDSTDQLLSTIRRLIATDARFKDSRPGVALVVRDNGAGISKTDLPKLFRPFFTIKEKAARVLAYGLFTESSRRSAATSKWSAKPMEIIAAPPSKCSFQNWLPTPP